MFLEIQIINFLYVNIQKIESLNNNKLINNKKIHSNNILILYKVKLKMNKDIIKKEVDNMKIHYMLLMKL